MDLEQQDKGVIAVVLKRFEHERYPKLQTFKANVENGGVLDDDALAYLEKILTDAHQVMAVVKRHPEYAALAKGALLMYEEIMSQSQLNSNKA
ncbi:MAG: hypothetical protein P8M49_07395 [Thalassotalea sp.]|nr:hypothetical protein [Thalassotalea sp.]MDG2393321.1 hypothetical protein [Thalassotalea sp.]